MKSRVLLCAALIAALFAFPALAADKGKRVENLEKKVAELEKQLADVQEQLAAMGGKPAGQGKNSQRLSALERRVGQLEQRGRAAAQPKDPAKERAAGELLRQARDLASAGQADQAKAKIAEFDKLYSGTSTARSAVRLKRELEVVGKPAPAEWKIDKWFQGQDDIDLSSGKPTLIVFWEVWCPHCRREVPKVQRLYDTYHDKGLQIVGLTKITKSSTEEKVSEFVEQNKLSYPIAKENGTISRYFNVSGIPAAAVVKGGKVIWRGHPAQLSEKMLQGLL